MLISIIVINTAIIIIITIIINNIIVDQGLNWSVLGTIEICSAIDVSFHVVVSDPVRSAHVWHSHDVISPHP